MNPSITQQAAQANQQGQQLLGQFRSNADTYTGQYNQNVSDYQQKAAAAQTAQSQYQNYQANMVDPTKLYSNALQSAQQSTGYNPGQLAQATTGLNQIQGVINGLVGDQNMGANAQGLSASALANQYQTNLQPLQAGLATQTSAVGNLTNLYQQTLAQAGAQAGSEQAGQQEMLQGYSAAVKQATDIATLAQQQADQARQQMQFFSDLAQKQGGLNASNAQSYAAAQQAYATAQQALAQSGLFLSQTTGQNIANTASQNQLNQSVASQKAKEQQATAAAQDKSNQMYQAMQPNSKPAKSNATTNGAGISGAGGFYNGLTQRLGK